MTHYRYFSKANQMSAILKQDLHRIRAAKPEHLGFSRKVLPDGRGVVIGVLSAPMKGRERHELAHDKHRAGNRR